MIYNEDAEIILKAANDAEIRKAAEAFKNRPAWDSINSEPEEARLAREHDERKAMDKIAEILAEEDRRAWNF